MSKRDRTTTSLRPAARGLTSFNQSRLNRTVTHWFTWRHLRCKLQETPNYFNPGWTLLQLEVIAARDTPCPITATGYLAHGIDAEELAQAGGAVAFLCRWMDREAANKQFQRAEFLWRQGNLLDPLALDEDRQA